MKNRIVIGELIDENSLLVVEKNNSGFMPVYVNYTEKENEKEELKQSYIGRLGKESIEFGFKAIAVFTPNASTRKLVRIYDLNTHSFIQGKFKYEFYRNRFREKYPVKTKKI